ncbi:MAG: hypothetical protein ABI836_01300 [Gemmatimonadota bacterium]
MRVGFKSMLLAGALAFMAACSDGTNPNDGGPRPADSLTILTLAQGHPPLAAQSVTFWARYDQDTEGRIDFQTSPTETEEYLKFKVPQHSLMRFPDGTAFATGDSVLITITVINADSLYFDFQPHGLKFSRGKPAELTLEYNHAGSTIEGDFNDDDQVDAQDALIEIQLKVWVQETPGGLFAPLTGILEVEFDEVQAEISGFSRFALAY